MYSAWSSIDWNFLSLGKTAGEKRETTSAYEGVGLVEGQILVIAGSYYVSIRIYHSVSVFHLAGNFDSGHRIDQ